MARNSRFAGIVDAATVAVGARRTLAEVTESERTIRDLGSEFDGFTIIALSDFHHGRPRSDLRWLRHAIDTANAFRPDVVVLLGDYGSSLKRAPRLSQRWYSEALGVMTPEFLRLRVGDALFAVLGNHDYYASTMIVQEWLRGIGADLLVNASRRVVRAGSALRVAGLDDLAEGTVDPLAGCDVDDRTPTIVLSHNPDAVQRLHPRLRVDVMIAGHTHGGQIVIPWLGALVTMSQVCGRRSTHGWITNPRAPLYVTRGLGEQFPLPIRIGCRPEILVLRLRAARQQPA